MMKINLSLLIIGLTIVSSSCVQETKKQTVYFSVDAREIEDVQTIGVRGSIEPFLSWNQSTLMLTDNDNDSIYTGELVLDIPFSSVEVKFIKNEEIMELEGKGNRELVFEESGTTEFEAVFDEQ